MQADEPLVDKENARIVGLESQILNSQEIIVRLNRELDSALLRISTLENVCSDNQNDLHARRSRIQQLNDELIEREETNDRLMQELQDKDELIRQLKETAEEDKNDDRSQISFDRELRELIVDELDDSQSVQESPRILFEQYQNHERTKFQRLLQKSLTTEDISELIDSDDVLFELLTHLNSLSRLKETLSRDSKQLQQIRSSLRLPHDHNEEVIQDLITKRECIEYLRTKIHDTNELTDFDLIKHVLHDYFNFQQQQIDLKEYLDVNDETNNDVNYCRMLIERCEEAVHRNAELNERLREQEQSNATTDHHHEVDLHSTAPVVDEESELDRLRTTLQSNLDFQQSLLSETSVVSVDELLPRIREYRSVYEDRQAVAKRQELDNEVQALKEQANLRKKQLTELTTLLETDAEDESVQFDLIRSSLKSLIDLREAIAQTLAVTADSDSILQRLNDYQRVLHELNPPETKWTNETGTELLAKLQSMKTSATTIEDLEKQLEEAIDNERQLQADIEEIADEFSPTTRDDRKSNLTRIHRVLQSLTSFRERISEKTHMTTDEEILRSISTDQEKQDVDCQTTNEEERALQKKMDEWTSTEEKLRDLLQIEDGNLVDSVMNLNKNFLQLKEECELLAMKEKIINDSVKRLMSKLGLSSDSSSRTEIDEICQIFDTFCLDYCHLTSADIETMNLIAIMEQVRTVLEENAQFKESIGRLSLDSSAEDLNALSKLQIYSMKVDALCQLIGADNTDIDRAMVMYQEQIEHDRDDIVKMSDFKERLLTQLSVEDAEQAFERIKELQQTNTDLKVKLQDISRSVNTVTSLNNTITEQRNKITEQEDTLEKIRVQRERMLSKMKEIKTNNESLTNQLKQVQQSLDEQHRMEVDYKNQIEELEQQRRSATNQLQVTLDECRTQEDLQETMKLELASIQEENETQRKLYESRCRQIINEKHQLDKSKNDLMEQKQLLEDENKHLQGILDTIRDTLENVNDASSIVGAIRQLQEEYLSVSSELYQRDEQMKGEREQLFLDVQERQSLLNECLRVKSELEKRLLDHEQQLLHFKQEVKEKNEQYQRLQDEYQSYKDENPVGKNTSVAIIDIEPPSTPPQPHLLPMQQAVESNHWMSIDMQDEEVPLTTTNKRHVPFSSVSEQSLTNTPTAILNFLGELKSKLGITLTHRPRSSSIEVQRLMPLAFREVNGDLFTSADDVALAHCVSRDLSMSKGIATLFRDKFGQVNELKRQNVSVGGCAYITSGDRHVFYLVTKERYYYKPTMATLEASLRVMRDLCLQNGVHRLAMPRIGCGLDRLNWDQVSGLIQRIFQDDEMEITIYTL